MDRAAPNLPTEPGTRTLPTPNTSDAGSTQDSAQAQGGSAPAMASKASPDDRIATTTDKVNTTTTTTTTTAVKPAAEREAHAEPVLRQGDARRSHYANSAQRQHYVRAANLQDFSGIGLARQKLKQQEARRNAEAQQKSDAQFQFFRLCHQWNDTAIVISELDVHQLQCIAAGIELLHEPGLAIRITDDEAIINEVTLAQLEKAFDAIGSALLANRDIRKLTLNLPDPLKACPHGLAKAIKGMVGLDTLTLENCIWERDGYRELKNAICGNGSIKSLEIAGGISGPDMIDFLCQVFGASPSVDSLSLAKTRNIGRPQHKWRSETYVDIAHALQNIIGLRSLKVHDVVSREESLALVELIEKNSGLTSMKGYDLWLSSDAIRAEQVYKAKMEVGLIEPDYPGGFERWYLKNSDEARLLHEYRNRVAAARERNWDDVEIRTAAAGFDLLLDNLPPDSALPAIPWDVRTVLAENAPYFVREQIGKALDSGFAASRDTGKSGDDGKGSS